MFYTDRRKLLAKEKCFRIPRSKVIHRSWLKTELNKPNQVKTLKQVMGDRVQGHTGTSCLLGQTRDNQGRRTKSKLCNDANSNPGFDNTIDYLLQRDHNNKEAHVSRKKTTPRVHHQQSYGSTVFRIRADFTSMAVCSNIHIHIQTTLPSLINTQLSANPPAV